MKHLQISNDHFQPETLSSFVNGKEALMWSTLKELKKGLDQDAKMINKALEENNTQQLRSLAHKIKPNFYLMGMNDVGQLCKELESVEFNDEGKSQIDLLLHKIPEVIKEIDDFTLGKLYHQL